MSIPTGATECSTYELLCTACDGLMIGDARVIGARCQRCDAGTLTPTGRVLAHDWNLDTNVFTDPAVPLAPGVVRIEADLPRPP